ncbi:MAG TPA: SH3 domain-containing protein [Candidatus Dormibacteraeota bacterium]|nr:SH3 domain-containing protein [Candidatus Dormibacteraeota bacterium]
MPQFESVEDLRRVEPGQSATLIPSWNTGFPLRAEPRDNAERLGLVRPGQKLKVLAERDGLLQVQQEAEGLEGWIPAHVVTLWPDPYA